METKSYIFKTKIGYVTIIHNDKYLTKLTIDETLPAGISQKSEFAEKVELQIDEYINQKRKSFSIPFKLEGTDFQRKVWHQLLNIPYGELRTYKQIAQEIENPKAYRAVGNANNKNPLGIIVPCHRVIGANGELTGYAGGLNIKRKLIEIEKGNSLS